MILSPAPSWLPSLVQPEDWLMAQILVMLLVIGVITIFFHSKGGDTYGPRF